MGLLRGWGIVIRILLKGTKPRQASIKLEGPVSLLSGWPRVGI